MTLIIMPKRNIGNTKEVNRFEGFAKKSKEADSKERKVRTEFEPVQKEIEYFNNVFEKNYRKDCFESIGCDSNNFDFEANLNKNFVKKKLLFYDRCKVKLKEALTGLACASLMFAATSCNDDGIIVVDDYIAYPVNVPYEILYEGLPTPIPFPLPLDSFASCKWINLIHYDAQDSICFPPFIWGENLTIINSNEELENYLECSEESDFPKIDFSKHTLLLANFRFPAATAQRFQGLQRISKNNYMLNLEKVHWGLEVISHWVMVLLINKLPKESSVKLNLTIKDTLGG